jgi:polar amino acid transport system substrate-binding protein
MKKLILLGIIGVMLAGIVLASCSSAATTTTSGPMKILVATDATWPPFEYVNDKTNQIEGFDIDLLNAIAEKENLDIEYVNVVFDALLAGVAQGTYDAGISSITITEDRKKEMLFSDPYFAAGQIVTVRKSNTTITGKDTLTGDVGAQLGTTGAMEVAKLSGVNLKTYDDIGLAFQDLMNGQIDAVVCDNPVALGYVGKNPDTLKIVGTVFTDEYYGIAVTKGKEAILAKINAGIKAIIAEGLIEQFSEKWLEK